jgi:hypothetical protein
MYLHSPDLEHLPPSTLLAYAGNSRQHPPEQIQQIAGSIREFGFTRVVLIDERGMILAGHGATMAALALELDTVPCRRILGLSDAMKAAYVLADNKLGELSRWDDEKLRKEIEALQGIDFDLSLTGFNFDEIDNLLGSVSTDEPVSFEGSTDESTTGKEVPTLKFGKYKIEMTDDEAEALAAAVDAHVERFSSYHGFVTRLLNA